LEAELENPISYIYGDLLIQFDADLKDIPSDKVELLIQGELIPFVRVKQPAKRENSSLKLMKKLSSGNSSQI
jgi:hypothetical protein